MAMVSVLPMVPSFGITKPIGKPRSAIAPARMLFQTVTQTSPDSSCACTVLEPV